MMKYASLAMKKGSYKFRGISEEILLNALERLNKEGNTLTIREAIRASAEYQLSNYQRKQLIIDRYATDKTWNYQDILKRYIKHLSRLIVAVPN